MQTEAMPVYKPAPSGPLCQVLRKMLACPLTVVRTDGGLVAAVGGWAVPPSRVAGLVTRGLIEAAGSTELVTHYRLTANGKKWAQETKS